MIVNFSRPGTSTASTSPTARNQPNYTIQQGDKSMIYSTFFRKFPLHTPHPFPPLSHVQFPLSSSLPPHTSAIANPTLRTRQKPLGVQFFH